MLLGCLKKKTIEKRWRNLVGAGVGGARCNIIDQSIKLCQNRHIYWTCKLPIFIKSSHMLVNILRRWMFRITALLKRITYEFLRDPQHRFSSLFPFAATDATRIICNFNLSLVVNLSRTNEINAYCKSRTSCYTKKLSLS